MVGVKVEVGCCVNVSFFFGGGKLDMFFFRYNFKGKFLKGILYYYRNFKMEVGRQIGEVVYCVFDNNQNKEKVVLLSERMFEGFLRVS